MLIPFYSLRYHNDKIFFSLRKRGRTVKADKTIHAIIPNNQRAWFLFVLSFFKIMHALFLCEIFFKNSFERERE